MSAVSRLPPYISTVSYKTIVQIPPIPTIPIIWLSRCDIPLPTVDLVLNPATQNGINSSLRVNVVGSPWATACLSFSVGLGCVAGAAHLHRGRWRDFWRGVGEAEWYCFTGGLLGPVYVVSAVLLTEQLGFAAYQLFAIAGMLLASTACDAAGFLGIRRRSPTRARAAAMALLLVAAGLVAAEGGGRQRWGGTRLAYCLVAAAAGAIFPVQVRRRGARGGSGGSGAAWARRQTPGGD